MDERMTEKFDLNDEKTFQYIYDTYYVLLCRFACQMVDDAFLAKEIVGDVIFNLWEHRMTINVSSSLRSYLFTSVRNRCLNELNSARRQNELSLSSFSDMGGREFLDFIFDPDEHPLGKLIEQDLEEQFTRCLEELPDECRAVFRKSRLEQKKYEEIACELGISVNTVKYHMKRALSFMQSRMKPYLEALIWLFFFFIEKN